MNTDSKAATPLNVPKDFTKPTKSFKKHIFLAVSALFLFVGLYLTLMLWFAFKGYKLMGIAFMDDGNGWYFVSGIILMLLSFFMVKSLFIFGKKRDTPDLEIKQKDQPELFDFVYKIADQAGAPRPHRIFLSARVNAGVFYDLSIFNLIFPTKKNLEIGLGLVNTLNKGEFKAILAHEFGHFAQKSMLLGRYVYVAQQVAARIVSKRDWLDHIIRGLSQIDLRVAWIGWIISIIIWGMRSLIEVLFGLVVLADRALSREMEFQADKVAVSLTGSDALIHALSKLRAADEGYHAAINTLDELLKDKKAAPDLFALQSNYIIQMRKVMNDPGFGASPEREGSDSSKRIFTNSLSTPEMWSTHPADMDREANAKAVYIYSDIDETPAWQIFRSEEELREEITRKLLATSETESEVISATESIRKMDEEEFNWSFLSPEYKGAYLARNVFSNFAKVSDAFDLSLDDDLHKAYAACYPDDLREKLNLHRELKQEILQLEAVNRDAEKRKIMYKGKQIRRSELPEVISELKREEEATRKQLADHDRLCRSVNYQVAKNKSPFVLNYLRSLYSLVHYAEHSVSNLNDMLGKFNFTLNLVLSSRASDDNIFELLKVANQLHDVLSGIYTDSSQVLVDTQIQQKLEKPYAELFEDFKLPKANRENLNGWLNSVNGWISLAQDNLYKLRNHALEHMLFVEGKIRRAYENNSEIDLETGKIEQPESYPVLLPGKERRTGFELSFADRFFAGIGLFPNLAKFTVSALIVAAAVIAGSVDKQTAIYFYNGLGIPVKIRCEEKNLVLQPGASSKMDVDPADYRIVSTSMDGKPIDNFVLPVTDWSHKYVYNVANAAYFIEASSSYGYDAQYSESEIGAPKWFSTKADYVLEDLPASIYSRYSELYRTALGPLKTFDPQYIPGIMSPGKELKKMITSHVKWDPASDPSILSWIALSELIDPKHQLVNERLRKDPFEVVSWRFLQDNAPASQQARFIAKLNTLAKKYPQNSDLKYLQIRSMENGQQQNRLFLELSAKYPENAWFALAAGHIYAGRENWKEALKKFSIALERSRALSQLFCKDVERVARMAKQLNANTLTPAALNENDWVLYYRGLEAGMDQYTQDLNSRFFYMLSQKDIAQAQNTLQSIESPFKEHFEWFLAASNELDTVLINKVLDHHGVQTVTQDNIATAIGLLLRHNRPVQEFTKQFIIGNQMEKQQAQAFTEFVSKAKSASPAELEKILFRMEDFSLGAKCRLIAKIARYNKVPESWNKIIDGVLFIMEKPVFFDENAN